jgi:uncharacterized RDD family membrane protein YckC
MEWYFAEASQRLGPVDDAEFRSLRESGRITLQTLVWRSGMADWQPLSALDENPGAVFSPEGGFCTECGRAADAGELLAFGSSRVCANCKDVFFQRVREQGVSASQGNYHYGGFWIRFLARFIDRLILTVVVSIPLWMGFALYTGLNNVNPVPTQPPGPAVVARMMAGFGVLYIIEYSLNALYDAWFISHRGGTPGKLILGLQVIRSSGGPLSFWLAFGRYFAFVLSCLMMAVGCIIAGFDSEKRSLHDRICDTRVIYKRE